MRIAHRHEGPDGLRQSWTTTACAEPAADAPETLSVVVLFDRPGDFTALDEALFSVAVQDHETLDVIVVLPDAGGRYHRRVENMAVAQPWPPGTRLRVSSVATPASPVVSGDLVNAGLCQAGGRYVALLQHQDLVYQHAWRALIERLRATAAPVAFGGSQVATHIQGDRHWMVTHKSAVQPPTARLAAVIDGRAALHACVADRDRLDGDHLIVRQPRSRLSVMLFLLGLALHPQADFALAGRRMVETRIPPRGAGLQRLPSAHQVLAVLANATVRGDAFSATALLTGLVQAANPGAP